MTIQPWRASAVRDRRPKSQEVLTMVRAGYEGVNRGDLEAALAPVHHYIE
jgi:hypothetical protein